jgi:ligand-binding sensor domain-containing protein
MKYFSYLVFLLASLFPCSIIAQEYSYSHYDINDGLAGSTVYCITQDKDGFIWVGTESGVSRFDGIHFRNFNAEDGLPDLEILQIFGDSKGRVWMAPFRKSVCFYYRGKIHNPGNDSMLAKIRFNSNIESFAEDAKGNILLQERTALHLIGADNSVREIDSINHRAIKECTAISRSDTGDFLVEEGKQVFSFSGKGFAPFFPGDDIDINGMFAVFVALSPRLIAYLDKENGTVIRSFVTGSVSYRPPISKRHFTHISLSIIADSLVFINETAGTTEFNIRTKEMKKWLPGREVSRVFRDDDGSLWFTTMGKGLYRLNSEAFRNITIPVDRENSSSVYAIKKIGNQLLVGGSHNAVRRYILPQFCDSLTTGMYWADKNRYLYIDQLKNGDIILGSDYGFHLESMDFKEKNRLPVGLKSVFRKNDRELLIGAYWGAGIFDVDAFRITDTLWRERCTAIYFRDDSTYIGTLNGLYLQKKDRSFVYLGNTVPFLKNRISSIAASGDGTLWIGSYDNGIIGCKNGRQTVSLTSKQGLSSDMCKALEVNGPILWVATDKGLDKIDLNNRYSVTRYAANDGLQSDVVNIVLADGSTIYAGTAAGLSILDDGKAKMSDGCRLYLETLTVSGEDRTNDTAHLLLAYPAKQIRFEFAAISYKSAGKIGYLYRLKGVDETWRNSKENFLEYPTLPPGHYTLEIMAVNKFGNDSGLLAIPFVIVTPFRQSAWFYALIVVACLTLTWLFVSLRIRSIRRRQEEREMLSKKMIEMEHSALQSQMNPHFIFNCLNSIQQYIFDQDIYSANRYLTGFASLIRATLYQSTQSYINLEEEISYLSNYLSLEKLRFKDKMNYNIDVDPAVNLQTALIPPMIIQPYVENSIRHGIRSLPNGGGIIKIQILPAGDKLAIFIDDNGIGREKAMQNRTLEHIEYQSRGMSLTADRIRLINALHGDGIRIEVIDLKDDLGQALGTRVVIHFPQFGASPKNLS